MKKDNKLFFKRLNHIPMDNFIINIKAKKKTPCIKHFRAFNLNKYLNELAFDKSQSQTLYSSRTASRAQTN